MAVAEEGPVVIGLAVGDCGAGRDRHTTCPFQTEVAREGKAAAETANEHARASRMCLMAKGAMVGAFVARQASRGYFAFLTLPAQCAWSGEAGRKVVLGFSPNTRLSG